MPLDQQTKAILKQLEDMGGWALNEVSRQEAREAMAGLTELDGVPESVLDIANRWIPGPQDDTPIRVYTSGYTLGATARFPRWCTSMAAVGWPATWRWSIQCAPC